MSKEQLSIWQKFEKHGLNPAHTSLEGLATVDMGLTSVENGKPVRIASPFQLACHQHNLNPYKTTLQKLGSVVAGEPDRILSPEELTAHLGRNWIHQACKFDV